MNISDIFDFIKNFILDAGFIAPEFAWLKELFAIIADWFAGLFA